MTSTDERLIALVSDLLTAAKETTVVEFKLGNSDQELIAKYISALSNSAALENQREAYVLWGINNETKEVEGTHFDPEIQKGNKPPLQFWLSQQLKPAPNFFFTRFKYNNEWLVLLTIPATTSRPVEYKHIPYIRVNSATPRLSEHPEKQTALWSKLQTYQWESGIAVNFITPKEVMTLLDYETYFKLTGQSTAASTDHALSSMSSDGLIQEDVGGRYNILNLGAILFAHRLSDFDNSLQRKALRFTSYDGSGRDATVNYRQDGDKGYALSLDGFIKYLDALLPINEYISGAFREKTKLFPKSAIRELVANALMHQDMTVTGAGPLVELFKDRLEISDPGKSLIPPSRFLDAPPRSRNDLLAGLMRRMKMCEQQGTGIDKVIAEAELYQLPPPDFRQEIEAVRAVLFAPRNFSQMTPDERIRACYQHAGLRFVNGQQMTNSTLRARFGLDDSPSATSQVSKVIKAARDKGLIKTDIAGGSNHQYIPNWDN